jgi:hypothetical protein
MSESFVQNAGPSPPRVCSFFMHRPSVSDPKSLFFFELQLLTHVMISSVQIMKNVLVNLVNLSVIVEKLYVENRKFVTIRIKMDLH